MKISARNQLAGVVTQIKTGAVNSEIAIRLPTGQELVVIITCESVANLGLQKGSEVIALIKAGQVILANELSGYQFSARNQLTGTITKIERGAVNSVVTLDVGGVDITAGITLQSTDNLGLDIGQQTIALIKANSIILGVKA